MASWTDQSTDSLLPGEPWTSAKALAAFENPVAITEGASGAPVQTAAWHPYNKTNVGDSGTGVYYSFATDGAVATAETPNFQDNYEYRLLGVNLGLSSTASAAQWNVDALVDGAWINIATTVVEGTVQTDDRFDFDCYIKSPRRNRIFVAAEYNAYANYLLGEQINNYSRTTALSSSNVVTRARVRYNDGSVTIGRGEIYLLRRREY